MTSDQWKVLVDVVEGRRTGAPPVGFIIDSPWLPNWFGVSILDYFTSGDVWLRANLKAVQSFPDVLFFPGFWSEFGMCTEPSAFGSRCSFPDDAFPHAFPVLRSTADIDGLPVPDPRKDGLLPFVLRRLVHARPRIEDTGHAVKFAVARGPLNIAGYLMGVPEFLTALLVAPDKAHMLLRKITDFLGQWIALQREAFPSIDGIFLLDDIVGFLGRDQFAEFGLPRFKELFVPDARVRFLHNDAPCRESIAMLPAMGVNLFNMGFDTDLNELREATDHRVAMMGNIPPRDVLAKGSPADVEAAVRKLRNGLACLDRTVLSCGGGMPPGVTTENIRAFVKAAGS